MSNEEITEKRNQARQALKENPDCKKLIEARAKAYRAQQDYLYDKDDELAQLKKRMDKERIDSH